MNNIVIPEKAQLNTLYFAGGCFWGVEAYFSHIQGVVQTSVGYANGNTKNPSYEDVCHHNSGHAETVEVVFDAQKITLQKLIEFFFKAIDPISINRQGNDIGVQYRTGIYFQDNADKDVIAKIIEDIQKRYLQPIAVELKMLEHYYLAEDYHQQYLRHNPSGYCHLDFNKILSGK